MKKILSIVLSICMLLSLCTVLSSCSLFECEFETEWSSDETSHWHNCKLKICESVSEKAEHTWDDGSVTTKATQEADGVKTYTCTVCGKTKTEAIVFTGMTKTEWDAAFADGMFKNFAYSEVGSTSGNGVTIDSEMVVKVTEDCLWLKMTMAGTSEEDYAPDQDAIDETRELLVESLKSITPYDSYAYDAETKTYKATKKIYIETLGVSTKDITLTFEDGKLVEIKYAVAIEKNGVNVTANSTITISDYGTVVLNPPKK